MQLANRLDTACSGPGWHDSTLFRCLDYEFTVRANDPFLVHQVNELFAACSATGAGAHSFVLRRRASRPSSVSVYRDGRVVRRHATPERALAHLTWEVNRGVVEHAHRHLLLHAAAAERHGRIVLLAGPSGAGKSTLAAALVAAGLRYVTDEVVAIDCRAGVVEPYPKPIGLNRLVVTERWALGRDLEDAVVDVGGDDVLVSPLSIRADAVAPAGGVARLVVLPRYRAGSSTALLPIARSEAVVAIAEQAFNLRERSPGALQVVARVVRGCRCYRLEFGNVSSACDALLDVFASAR